LSVTEEQHATHLLIRLEGEVNFTSAQELKRLLLEGLASGRALQLDLERAGEIDVTVMQLLWAAEREAARAGLGMVSRVSEAAAAAARDRPTRARRVLLRRPFRVPPGYGLTAVSRGFGGLQEAAMSKAPVLPRLDLQPGELYLAHSPAILRTILGSCVGVTFWSARLGAGALCHGVLPRCPQAWLSGSSLTDGHRYVDFSIRYLAQQFDALGASRSELEVKLFGGADVLPISESRQSIPSVGALNCTAATEVLAEEGFTVSASDLGGVRGRRSPDRSSLVPADGSARK
jgi:chemotaxis protein CheD